MFQVKTKEIFSCSGSAVRFKYKKSFSKADKIRKLVKVGEENLYNFIQTFKDDNNVYKLLEKYHGDMTKLIQVQKGFEDLKTAPKTLNELNEMVSNYTNSFNELPSELKNKFGNNPYEFISKLGTSQMTEVLSDFYQKKGVPVSVQKQITPDYIKSDNVDNKEVKDNE